MEDYRKHISGPLKIFLATKTKIRNKHNLKAEGRKEIKIERSGKGKTKNIERKLLRLK